METNAAHRRRDERAAPRSEGSCEAFYVDEARVARAAAAIPETATVGGVAELFGLLADPTRVRLLLALSAEELCVCDLAKLVGRSMAATSHQLRLLRDQRIVTFRMDGKFAYYSLESERVRRLLQDAAGRPGAEDAP